jgi:hypothetical protein
MQQWIALIDSLEAKFFNTPIVLVGKLPKLYEVFGRMTPRELYLIIKSTHRHVLFQMDSWI